MTLRLRWTLVLMLATTLLLAAVAAALELGLRDLVRSERESWLRSREDAVLERLQQLQRASDDRLRTLVLSGELDRLLEGVGGGDPAVLRAVADWAATRRAEAGTDELLVIDASGRVLTSALDAAAVGEPHPDLEFLRTVDPRGPLLWRPVRHREDRWLVGSSALLRVEGRDYLALAGMEVGPERLARMEDELGLRQLSWASGADRGATVRLPTDWRRSGDPQLAVVAGETAAARTLERVRGRLLALAAVALGLTLLLAPWLAAGLARPLTRLAEAVQEIGRGSRRPQLPRGGAREVRELSEALGHLTLDLERAEDRIRRAERRGAWREIARRIAHEIRNALSPLALALDNVETAVQRDDAEARRALRTSLLTARDQLDSLRRLVSEFHGFARTPRLQIAPFDPHALLESAAEAVRATAGEARVRLDASPTLLDVHGDAEQLRRALHNLLKNAIESAPGDEVTLAAGVGPQTDSWWLEVRDRGPGLDAAVAARLGEPYLTTKPSGTGLGLPLVVQVAEAHGGRLEWRPATGGGLVMRVVLPVRPTPVETEEEEP